MFKNESDFEKIISQLNIDTKSNPAHRESLRRQMLSDFDKTQHEKNAPSFCRVIINSKVVKMATAAVVIIAALLGMRHFWGSIEAASVAFADVAESILIAHTASFDVTLEMGNQPLQTSHFLCMIPGLIKQTMADGTINIVNYEQHKVLILDTNDMTATLRDVKLKPSADPILTNILGEIQECIKQALYDSSESIELLGHKLIDGHEALGFRVELAGRDKIIPWQGKGTFTVWADPKTELPIRLEWSDQMLGVSTVVTNIELNVELDESVFSMEIPEGYALIADSVIEGRNLSLKLTDKEEKIIDGFRCWAYMADGNFPSSLSLDAIKDLDSNADVSFRQKGWGVEGSVSFSDLKAFKPELDVNTPPSEEELKEIEKDLEKQLKQFIDEYYVPAIEGFAIVFKFPSDSDWHYAGKDVKFGDADTPIFWYRPEGSETYRVIYGDLSVADVAPEDLPK